MIQIADKSLCCGCSACVLRCPKQCISLHEDHEGFLYPKVDIETCIDCALCEKVCPILNEGNKRKPSKVYAAINKDEKIRLESSSGGIFTLLAEQTIREGGVVFGARFNDKWNVIHSWTDTIEGIADFRGSKYVQSTIGDTYREAKDFLKQGRKVLFSGTPCQIAGLKKYLRKDYDNLLTVDVVCHGVPSPLVWRTYLDETRKQLRAERGVGKNTLSLSIDELPVITGISFRDKTNGWKKFGFRLRYAASEAAENSVFASAIKEEQELLQPFSENVFMKGFLRNLYLRPSCYACSARSGKSGSDISIADFWGVQNYYPEFDDDKGVGLILINSYKGTLNYDEVDMTKIETTYELGLRNNPCMEHSVRLTSYSTMFWNEFSVKGVVVINPIVNMMKPTFLERIVSVLKRLIKKYMPETILCTIRKRK